MAIALRGERELMRALAHADRETRLGVRRELRGVAEPVRSEAQALALTQIRNMPQSPKWGRMRTGVTQKLVYVAPRQKGTRGRRRGTRPNLADLLMDRAMEPALHHNEPRVERDLERMLDRIADDFNHGTV
jgi:hypothetical protein